MIVVHSLYVASPVVIRDACENYVVWPELPHSKAFCLQHLIYLSLPSTRILYIQVAERARQGLHKIMAVLDTWLQGQGPYMLGSAFTTPDIMNATPFYWLEVMGAVLFQGSERVLKLPARPAWAHGYVWRL